ncbi:LysR substrate-binding domain-containing protein [Roseomonas sp. NAR14]|uniref:LysR substrate-binding domain-containing protein n=1 Tax=Roseomonas acroporae TaxID=2937791 RepID=A0A9X1YCP6_9PROT|nr:LysR substrate-binding domain-containing protein [Roseomonas acroporae]MCK8786287.1 LysR substrate-binding domain-containing protein [Roseomonas acroporae]
MELRQIRALLALAETGHLGRAAERLGLAPSTLSHHLAALERSLGTTLFDRVGRGLRLTESGALFRDFARRIAAEAAAAEAAIAELERAERGVLRLGVIHSFHERLLPTLLAEFLRAHPAVRVETHELVAGEVEARLLAGELDLGLAFLPRDPAGLTVQPLFREALVLMLAPGSEWAGTDPAAIPLALLPPRFATRRMIDAALAGRFRPRIVAEMASIASILALVRTGAVGTILSDRAAGAGEVVRLPLGEPQPMRQAALLWATARYQTAAARRFTELARRRLGGR